MTGLIVKEGFMSEGLQDVNQSVEQVVTTADDNLSSAQSTEPVVYEKVFGQQDVSKIAGREHRRGYDEGYKRAQAELLKAQGSVPSSSSAQDASLTPDELKQIARQQAREELQAAEEARLRQEAERQQQEYLQRHAQNYHQNVTAGKEKYPDFEQQLDRVKWVESPGALAITPLINEFDNAADIMYELSKKDDKLASLIGKFQHGKAAEGLIRESLTKLSESIKQNEIALANAKTQPRPPLGTINPSNRGTDGGRLSVEEARNKYKA